MANTSSTIKLIFDGVARGLLGAAAEARAAVKGVADEGDKSQTRLSKLSDAFTSSLPFIAKWGSIGVLAGAGIGQAAAGAIPLVLALGAAFTTVKLGMDGIKAAAQTLQGPFDQLKKNISATFQEQLTPVFHQLAGVIPQL